MTDFPLKVDGCTNLFQSLTSALIILSGASVQKDGYGAIFTAKQLKYKNLRNSSVLYHKTKNPIENSLNATPNG